MKLKSYSQLFFTLFQDHGLINQDMENQEHIKANSPLHVGISLRSALRGTLSGSLSVTLADESWKSPLIETHIRIYVQLTYKMAPHE